MYKLLLEESNVSDLFFCQLIHLFSYLFIYHLFYFILLIYLFIYLFVYLFGTMVLCYGKSFNKYIVAFRHCLSKARYFNSYMYIFLSNRIRLKKKYSQKSQTVLIINYNYNKLVLYYLN